MRFRNRSGFLAGVQIELTRGFTLVELMVSVVIVAVVAAVAVPAFTDMATTHRLSSYAASLAASAQLARSEAVKVNKAVTMCRSANPTADAAVCASSGGWQQGWIVFRDDDGDGVKDAAEPILLRQEALSADYSVNSDGSNALTFLPSVVGTTSANFVIYRSRPTVSGSMRCLRISSTGRVAVETGTGTSCPAL
jgi:type IV fimbrial biogenesis protein FimT